MTGPVRELAPGEYSAYRDDAATIRGLKADPPPAGMTQAEWEDACEQMARYWDNFADSHEQAMREGRYFDFPCGKRPGNDT